MGYNELNIIQEYEVGFRDALALICDARARQLLIGEEDCCELIIFFFLFLVILLLFVCIKKCSNAGGFT